MVVAVDVPEGTADAADEKAAQLVDLMVEQRRELTRAQAALAATMLDFTDTRTTLDEAALLGQRNARGGRRMRPGEFASTEIALALLDTRNRISGRVGTYRLLRDQQPTVWRAFRAGHVPLEAADLIAGTVRRLVKDESIALLDKLVVDVAACTALPLLDRWLQQFITRSEPEQQDERTRRKLADRRVRVRPDVDGVSSLWASLSCLDAAAIDAVLTALASSTAPSDPRTKQQRRADALVDLLLGRVSNGCHVTWIPTADPESGTPEPEFESPAVDTENPSPDREAPSSDADLDPWELTPADHRPTPTIEPSEPAVSLPIECLTFAGTDTSAGADTFGDSNVPAVAEVYADADQAPTEPAHDTGSSPPASEYIDASPLTDDLSATDTTPPAPATDCGKPRRRSTAAEGLPPPTLPLARIRVRDSTRANSTELGTILITPCLGDWVPRALPTVTIGVVVTLPSLLGATNTPGQLADRTGSIPADTIRSLAAHPDTRLHRLLSTPAGTLLDVTELGRYPSPKLATAVRWRDATCITPGCTTSAGGCDLDHIVPHPHGPTAACNLGPGCRHNHRAKTHADHRVSRDADGTYTWTTPTGHTYHRTTPPCPSRTGPISRTIRISRKTKPLLVFATAASRYAR